MGTIEGSGLELSVALSLVTIEFRQAYPPRRSLIVIRVLYETLNSKEVNVKALTVPGSNIGGSLRVNILNRMIRTHKKRSPIELRLLSLAIGMPIITVHRGALAMKSRHVTHSLQN